MSEIRKFGGNISKLNKLPKATSQKVNDKKEINSTISIMVSLNDALQKRRLDLKEMSSSEDDDDDEEYDASF